MITVGNGAALTNAVLEGRGHPATLVVIKMCKDMCNSVDDLDPNAPGRA